MRMTGWFTAIAVIAILISLIMVVMRYHYAILPPPRQNAVPAVVAIASATPVVPQLVVV